MSMWCIRTIPARYKPLGKTYPARGQKVAIYPK